MACRPLFSAPHLVASREQTSRLRRVLDRGQRSERRAAACAWNWRGLVWGRFGRRAEAAEEEEGAAAMNAIELSSEAAERQGEGWVQLARAGARRSRHQGEQTRRPHEFLQKTSQKSRRKCLLSVCLTHSVLDCLHIIIDCLHVWGLPFFFTFLR